MAKDKVTIILRGVPDDVHALIVAEKARVELSTGRAASNPQAIFQLIRRSKNT
jgi:hypothetical protein